MALSPQELRLLDGWQRGFPLTPRPFETIARDVGQSEESVLALLLELKRRHILSRIGATLRPNTAGASLLAAMRVPPARIDEVAEIVNREVGVNHNYEREHEINLWFVVTGADRASVGAALDRIRTASGLDVFEFPLVRAFHIDLGFPLDGACPDRVTRKREDTMAPEASINARQRRALTALEEGIPIAPRPYALMAERAGLSEETCRHEIGDLIAQGVITRFGLIVRHRELGFEANAMTVWDVPDEDVETVGRVLSQEPCVTLCYQRPRRPPDWPYNLYCMIHGRERNAVLAHIERLEGLSGLNGKPKAILFSRRCFRQRGARLNAA